MRSTIEKALAESRVRGHATIYRRYSKSKRGVVLDAEWTARDGKVFFIPTMWCDDDRGGVRVKERPLEEITVARCVEMLTEVKADLEAGSNALTLGTATGAVGA